MHINGIWRDFTDPLLDVYNDRSHGRMKTLVSQERFENVRPFTQNMMRTHSCILTESFTGL